MVGSVLELVEQELEKARKKVAVDQWIFQNCQKVNQIRVAQVREDLQVVTGELGQALVDVRELVFEGLAVALVFGEKAVALVFGEKAVALAFGVQAVALVFGEQAVVLVFGEQAVALVFGVQGLVFGEQGLVFEELELVFEVQAEASVLV